MGAPGVDPAGGGGPDLAVLFFPAFLPDDELQRKGVSRNDICQLNREKTVT